MTYDFRVRTAASLSKGDIVEVVMKHGSWFTEVKKGVLLEVGNVQGDNIIFVFRSWFSGPKIEMNEVETKAGKIRLQSIAGNFPRGLTVKKLSKEDVEAKDEAQQARGGRPF